MGWVKNFLDSLLGAQDEVVGMVSETKRQEGYGRAAELIVDGPEGGVFPLWFCETGVQPKPETVPIKNTVYLTEDCLLDLITPDLKGLDLDVDSLRQLVAREGMDRVAMKLYPRLDFRTAYANGLIRVSGDKSDVDSEEWARLIEHALVKIGFPIVIRGMMRKRKKIAK